MGKLHEPSVNIYISGVQALFCRLCNATYKQEKSRRIVKYDTRRYDRLTCAQKPGGLETYGGMFAPSATMYQVS